MKRKPLVQMRWTTTRKKYEKKKTFWNTSAQNNNLAKYQKYFDLKCLKIKKKKFQYDIKYK